MCDCAITCWSCEAPIAVGEDVTSAVRSVNDEAPDYRGSYRDDEDATTTVHLCDGCAGEIRRIQRAQSRSTRPASVTYRMLTSGPLGCECGVRCACEGCQPVVDALRASVALGVA
jgi:hypothetical protein